MQIQSQAGDSPDKPRGLRVGERGEFVNAPCGRCDKRSKERRYYVTEQRAGHKYWCPECCQREGLLW